MAAEHQVVYEPELNRYSIKLEGIDDPAVLTYREVTEDAGTVYEMTHTFVAPEMRGMGIAGKLVNFAIDHARKEGHKVRPICSYVVRHMERNKGDRDVLAEE